MRRKIVAGNWKMNKRFDEAEELISEIADIIDAQPLDEDIEMIICPPFLFLEMATDIASESEFHIGAQNVSEYDAGAYTGEVSAQMLNSIEVEYCIIGHSERRKYFAETDEVLATKINLALANEIEPIFCCGEVLSEREAKIHFDTVRTQIEKGLFHLSPEQFYNVVIAYEPIWAIGTGVVASPAQAQEMHAYIRGLIKEKYGAELAEDTTILYGGSCNADNATVLFSQPDVDGGLIGGASLKAKDFVQIARSF
ncbi:MAG TPA: triose-phosphate isomerase [Bacteroidales bacterium]|nr:MAG: triose-phosphate isomerase [Bacteroidetes bacterium GWE2_42_24]OFY31635.1 MAG: triose-phosphate isomerase [Bacteroidetes bacterium GWF2_43_11]HAQ64442.1 triose-phosphate isomerase [Bacteroidales bacterium]HBZ67108.1 triose-phosphate isomerase [Bacteroidales bacterium]